MTMPRMAKNTRQKLMEELRARRKEGWNGNERIVGYSSNLFEAMTRISDVLDQSAENLAQKGHLSPKGIQEELRSTTKKVFVPMFREAGEAVGKMRADADAWRSQLKLNLSKPDPGNLAAAILRSDIRAYIGGLEGLQKEVFLSQPDIDPIFIEAAFEGPAQLCGMLPQNRVNIENAIVSTRYAKELSQIQEIREAADLLETSLNATYQDVSEGLGFRDTGEFSIWTAQPA